MTKEAYQVLNRATRKEAMKEADQILEEAAATFKQRKLVYKDNYKRVGEVLAAFFPEGMELKTPLDHVRYHIFTWIVGKLSRYAINWDKGGHQDSIHDIIVYSAMLEGIDHNAQLPDR